MMKEGMSEDEAFQVASSELMKFSEKMRQQALPPSLVRDDAKEEREGRSGKKDQLDTLLGYFKTVKERGDKKEPVGPVKKTLVQRRR